MFAPSTRTVVVLALCLHSSLGFSQNPDCPAPTFFKTLGNDNSSEYGTALTQSGDGNLYLAGRNGSKTFIQKTTFSGETIWMREFQISPFEGITPSEVIVDSEGMIVGCGTQTLFAGARRGFVFRYNPVADSFLWAHPITSNNPTAAGILEKEAGGTFVYYQNPVLPGAETDIEILDLERATGNIIPAFARRYEHISFDALSKMVVVEGSLYGFGWAAGLQGTGSGARRALLARFDPVNGMPIWAKLSHVDTSELVDLYGRDMVADSNSLVAAYAGNDKAPGSGVYNLYLQKTDLNGDILWVRRYDYTGGILKLLSVPDGYVVYGQQNGNEYYALKTDKSGMPLWARRLVNGPAGSVFVNNFATTVAVSVADSLYFTGLSTNGFADVFFWKMLANGGMADSCGFVQNLNIDSEEIQSPANASINLQQLLSTAQATTVDVPWTSNLLEEHLLCPDCTVPDPCPQDNDFVADINAVSCSGGFVNMSVSICDLDGGALPDLSITFYNANPYTQAADKLDTYDYNASGPDSCASFQLTNLANLFGANAVQNGFQIFAVVNDFGNASTPFSSDDFPLTDVEECDYANNLDSITVQLPTPPTLALGADQSICANETVTLNAGPGFFKYQWSNGATTQTTTVNFGGQFRVTTTDACGFKQSDTILVQVRQLPLVQENGEFCPGKSVTIRGFTFDQAGIFQETILGVNGDCDTSVTFFIDQLPYEERIETISFCPFESVTINGVTYETSGLALDTFPASIGCDTIVFYFLNQLPLPFRNYQFDVCPGETVTFNGQVYTQPIDFTDTLYSSGIGCDTIAYVSIDYLPHPERAETIQFCPGTVVDIGGQGYTQPGTVLATEPGTGGGCDTLVTYTLEWLPIATIERTIAFCPGTSVTIGGQTYTQPGTAVSSIPGAGGDCDTLVLYTLQFAPLPTRSETREFCEGGSISLGGQTYTQPTTVTLTLPGAGNHCDTLVTYTLNYLTPPPSSMSLACPPILNVATVPGSGPVAVNYNLPTATSNCVCPGIEITLTGGLPSGASFPVGDTNVCYSAEDICGASANCCFKVTVREELPCDTKTNGCLKYDILAITADAQQRRSYHIRVTNNCANKLIYTAIQLPDGVTAVSPANGSTFTSPEGLKYLVRNPNYSPFYSTRFKSTTDSISNGQSVVLEYTLPAQANPTFIHVTSRLAPQIFLEAHLNTFSCPIGVTQSQNRGEDTYLTTLEELSNLEAGIFLFPNPTNGELFADLSRWQGQVLNVQILDSHGQLAQSLTLNAGSEAQPIPLGGQLPAGLYFLETVTENGEREVGRFVLER